MGHCQGIERGEKEKLCCGSPWIQPFLMLGTSLQNDYETQLILPTCFKKIELGFSCLQFKES